MLIKDYYTILEISPQATLPEIKQAYRRLAMIYHPDKNSNDPYTLTQFNEIKEAYEVLTNPAKKEVYLQERWYNQSIGNKRAAITITPVTILKLCLELEKYISRLDVYRMNKEGLFSYITELLSDDTIEKLKQFNEPGINRQVVTTILNCMKPLPLRSVNLLLPRLEKLVAPDELALQKIREFLSQYKKTLLWDKYKILLIVILTAMICLLIYFTSK